MSKNVIIRIISKKVIRLDLYVDFNEIYSFSRNYPNNII